MKHIITIAIAALSVIACKNKNELKATKLENTKSVSSSNGTTTAEKIAYANGIEHWKSIDEISFTFNVKRGDNPVFSRAWTWQPKTNNVSVITATDTLAYNRNNVDSLALQADKAFINDKYWLHAPYNLVWDEGTTITEQEDVIAPISKDTLNVLTITYNDSLGYTPGDAYDLYYDETFKVREWAFRKDNSNIPAITTTWEDYKTYNNIELATMHKDSTGNFQLYFTDISVKSNPKTN